MEKFVNSILLSNNIIIYLFSQTILYVLLCIAFYNSIQILKNWDFNKTTSLQYKLEKKSYLVILIISFVLIVKLILFPYFTYSLDELSNIVPGAMCAAGIVGANEYGEINLALKIFIIFIIGAWLIINNLDLKAKTYPYTKKKYLLFSALFLLITVEIVLDFLYLTNISTQQPVMCCSIIFGVNSVGSKIPFNLSIPLLITLFYLLFILTIFTNILKKSTINIISNLLFFYIAYYAVTYFFSTYIYELPTHQCPFCMLQHEYHYIGYFIWITLFLGVFFGISNYLLKILIKKEIIFLYILSIIFNAIFTILVSFYLIRYYLINGVFL